MDIILSLLLCISCNMDNIIFAMEYGKKNIKIPFQTSLVISLVSTVITVLCIILGRIFSSFLSVKFANIFGALILISLGIYFLMKELINYDLKDKKALKSINIKHAMLLSFGLSINNMPIAIAGGVSNLNIFLVMLFSAILNSLFILIGNNLGKKIKGKIISIIAPIILIILGIVELIVV